MADNRHSRRTIGTLRKDRVQTTTERSAAGQVVEHREHWDGSVDVTASVLTVKVKAKAEVVHVGVDAEARPEAIAGKMGVEA